MTTNVTKKSVSQIQKDLWSITLNLTCLDGETELINKDFSEKYRGKDINKVIEKIKTEMQTEIDKYNDEEAIFKDTNLDSEVNKINIDLTNFNLKG